MVQTALKLCEICVSVDVVPLNVVVVVKLSISVKIDVDMNMQQSLFTVNVYSSHCFETRTTI